MYLRLEQLRVLCQPILGYSAAETKRKNKAYWQSIDWKRANRLVNSLQRRIVEAIKSNRWGKVKSLQWILTHSFSAKVLAIRRVTENQGSKTSGIDQELWNSSHSKWTAIGTLKRKGYRAKAVKRVKIFKDKSKGTYRMLGIPTMRDRAMQALYLQALQPMSVWNLRCAMASTWNILVWCWPMRHIKLARQTFTRPHFSTFRRFSGGCLPPRSSVKCLKGGVRRFFLASTSYTDKNNAINQFARFEINHL